MANERNLTPFTSGQSHDEAVKNGKKGGVASGVARRRRKTMRQTLNTLLSTGLDVSEQEFVEKVTPRLLAAGINVGDATYQDVMLAGILLKAIRGDVRAAEFIRDTGGENPHLELKKQELKLRKDELKFKQDQESGKPAVAETAPRQIDLSKVTDEELEALDEITGKLFTE